MALVNSCFTQSVKEQKGSNPFHSFVIAKKCVYIRRLALWEQNTLQCFHLSLALERFPFFRLVAWFGVCFTVCPSPCLVSDLVYNLVGDSKVSFRGLTFTWTLTWPRNSLFLRYWRFLKFPLAISMSPLSYLQRWVGHCFYCGGQVRLSLSTFRRFSVFKVQKRFYQIMASMASNEFNENA